MPFRDWWASTTGSPLRTETLLAIAAVVILAARATLHRSRLGRRLDAGLTISMIALLALALGTGAGAEGADAVVPYAQAVFAAALAIALVRIALILLVDVYLRERQHLRVSAIVRDIAGMAAYFVIVLMVLRATLDINLASLIATSAVLTAIVGLAFQDVLGSIISGLVLEAEEPFRPNDWVRVGAFEGQVVETGWRTTDIRTRNNEVIVLPNTYLAREPLVNYSRPDPRHRDNTMHFEAAYEAPPNTVKAAVLDVLRADPAVLAAPEPEVHTTHYNASGIEYEVRFWVEDFANLLRIRDRIMTNIWYALRRAGVRIPFPATDLFVRASEPTSPLEAGDVAGALAHVPLLEPLDAGERAALAARAQRLPFARGEAIVREGETGDSFYLIERGTVAVSIASQSGTHTINHMGSGHYFGEMSLLTGDPRSATVIAESDVAVIELGRAAFEQILVANPALLEPISQIAAHRQEAQQETRRAHPVIPPFAQDAAAQRLRQRIRAFFRL